MTARVTIIEAVTAIVVAKVTEHLTVTAVVKETCYPREQETLFLSDLLCLRTLIVLTKNCDVIQTIT